MDTQISRTYRCFALFSGGLDSMLAVKHMQRLGYEVLPIFFKTPFFGPKKAQAAADALDVELIVHDLTEKHIAMLKNPRYGYGKFMNPCIDCHGLMFREAALLMEQYKVDFLISGEVLGQRPMSQRYDALNSVGKLSSVKDLLVRPLSQKLLADTLPIREGWVDKAEMLDIQGRGRHRQMALAKEWGITDYENPGGGCLLTDKSFSLRLKDLMKYDQFSLRNIEFLTWARHYRLTPNCKLILGRNHADNEALTSLVQDELVLKCEEHTGPMGVLICATPPSQEELRLAASLLLRYVKGVQTEGEVSWGKKCELQARILAPKMPDDDVKQYIIL